MVRLLHFAPGMGVVEAVFPEADEYPSYRVLPKPIRLPRQDDRDSAIELERYVREALRATRTMAVAR